MIHELEPIYSSGVGLAFSLHSPLISGLRVTNLVHMFFATSGPSLYNSLPLGRATSLVSPNVVVLPHLLYLLSFVRSLVLLVFL